LIVNFTVRIPRELPGAPEFDVEDFPHDLTLAPRAQRGMPADNSDPARTLQWHDVGKRRAAMQLKDAAISPETV